MLYRLAADALVVIHLGFIVFVVAGGFLAWRWQRLAWLHLPAAAWGATIELAGWICPLTPLENHFRRLAGGMGYEGGFVEQYLIPVLYPEDWSVALRIVLGGFVVLVNGFAYAVYFWRAHHSHSSKETS